MYIYCSSKQIHIQFLSLVWCLSTPHLCIYSPPPPPPPPLEPRYYNHCLDEVPLLPLETYSCRSHTISTVVASAPYLLLNTLFDSRQYENKRRTQHNTTQIIRNPHHRPFYCTIATPIRWIHQNRELSSGLFLCFLYSSSALLLDISTRTRTKCIALLLDVFVVWFQKFMYFKKELGEEKSGKKILIGTNIIQTGLRTTLKEWKYSSSWFIFFVQQNF